jgi:hypothetical protein
MYSTHTSSAMFPLEGRTGIMLMLTQRKGKAERREEFSSRWQLTEPVTADPVA